MTVHDPTSQDSAVIDDDLVEALGFEPITSPDPDFAPAAEPDGNGTLPGAPAESNGHGESNGTAVSDDGAPDSNGHDVLDAAPLTSEARSVSASLRADDLLDEVGTESVAEASDDVMEPVTLAASDVDTSDVDLLITDDVAGDDVEVDGVAVDVAVVDDIEVLDEVEIVEETANAEAVVDEAVASEIAEVEVVDDIASHGADDGADDGAIDGVDHAEVDDADVDDIEIEAFDDVADEDEAAFIDADLDGLLNADSEPTASDALAGSALATNAVADDQVLDQVLDLDGMLGDPSDPDADVEDDIAVDAATIETDLIDADASDSEAVGDAVAEDAVGEGAVVDLTDAPTEAIDAIEVIDPFDHDQLDDADLGSDALDGNALDPVLADAAPDTHGAADLPTSVFADMPPAPSAADAIVAPSAELPTAEIAVGDAGTALPDGFAGAEVLAPAPNATEVVAPATTGAAAGAVTQTKAQPMKRRRGRRRRIRARKSRRVIRHIDPWSVLTFSVLFHMCVFGAMLLGSVLVWNVAIETGTVENVENFIQELGDYETFEIQADVMFRAAVIIAGLFTLASSILVVLLTVVFNLISDLIGGIRVTVIEEESVRVPPRKKKRRVSSKPARSSTNGSPNGRAPSSNGNGAMSQAAPTEPPVSVG